MPFDAVILAGARSARLGGVDKALTEIGGRTLLDRVLDGVADAAVVVGVGPFRSTDRIDVWCEEEPAGGGPVAAFAEGISRTSARFVLLLAADLPFVAGAVEHLLAAIESGGDPDVDVAMLVDRDGRRNFLASAWRRDAAARALARLPSLPNASMRSLIQGLSVVEVPDLDCWSMDCDTTTQLDSAAARLAEHEETQLDSAAARLEPPTSPQ